MDEDAGELAKPVKVDLNTLFHDLRFESVEELGLGGAQPLVSVPPCSHCPLASPPSADMLSFANALLAKQTVRGT